MGLFNRGDNQHDKVKMTDADHRRMDRDEQYALLVSDAWGKATDYIEWYIEESRAIERMSDLVEIEKAGRALMTTIHRHIGSQMWGQTQILLDLIDESKQLTDRKKGGSATKQVLRLLLIAKLLKELEALNAAKAKPTAQAKKNLVIVKPQ